MGFWQSNNSDQDADKTIIDLGEVLDISFAAKFHTSLKDDISANSTVSFVSADLTRLDASCLQVLASFMGYAKEKEITVQWDSPNDIVIEAARLTGLTDVLALNN